MKSEDIRKTLECRGMRCTLQRHAVMSFLVTHHSHPTAAEVYVAVNRLDPRCSRATTYNTLRDLVKAGLVRKVAIEGRAARFDAKRMKHHHFVCDRCGVVEDMDWYEVPSPSTAALGKRVFRETELIFRGLCERCTSRRSLVKSARR